jgi:MFS family permease
MIERVAGPFALVAWLAAVLGAIGAVGLRVADPVPQLPSTFGFGEVALVSFAVLGVSFASVGGLLMVRRPRNSVGWLMVMVGIGFAVGVFFAALTFSLAAHHSSIGGLDYAVTAWLTVLFTTALGGLVFVIAFIFPTGRGQSPAWDRVLIGLVLFSPVMLLFTFLLRPGPLHVFPTIDNPFGIGPDVRPWLGPDVSARISAMSAVLVPVTIWSLVTRYRAADRLERQQLKWFGLACAVTIAALAVAGVSATFSKNPPEFGLALFGFAGALVPVAIGMAILRYHLYDIDRLISRTISYAIVTGVLLVLFGISIVALQALLADITQRDTIAVAASTLAVLAVSQPILRRVGRAIDRRFDRARYDAERTAVAFAGRLRDDIDMERITSDLVTTTTNALAPSRTGIWLREGPR